PIPDAGTVALANCGGVPQTLFGIARGGPTVLPGKYSVTVTPMGGTPMKSEVAVLPDPRFKISEADRKARWAAIMSAYNLQQQMVPARDAAQQVTQHVAAIRQFLSAAGDGGRAALPALEKVTGLIGQLQVQMNRPLTSAATVQSAMDGYDG